MKTFTTWLAAVTLLCWFNAPQIRAQELGLDDEEEATPPPKKVEPPKPEPKKEEPKKTEPRAEPQGQQSLAKPSQVSGAADKKTVEVREDRIKSVQRKPFLKKARWEITPLFTVSLNDAFYQKMGGGASFAYHVADNLGIEVQGIYVGTIQTDMVTFFQQANQALPKTAYLKYYLTGNIMWSPIYGKLGLFTDEIVHFDAYLLGGFGMASTETGMKFASNIGLGLRYFATSWLVIKLEVRDLIYTETLSLDIQRTKFSDVQNHVMLSAGVSFFLPVDFEYEYQ